MHADDLISVENVSYTPKKHPVLIKNLSFSVKKGECWVLTGPNGSGKSTTLNIIMGLIKPHAGRIVIAGLDIEKEPVLTKKTIGFLPEKPPLYNEFTVEESLMLAAKLHLIPKEHRNTLIDSMIERLDLKPYRHYLIHTLSKGCKQRVGIAQILLHTPSILILDEPTQGLDQAHIKSFQRLLNEYKKEGAAIILSTHYLQEVEDLCDKTVAFHSVDHPSQVLETV